jgi:F0F1-type ATP synthase membrane subunit b/b'
MATFLAVACLGLLTAIAVLFLRSKALSRLVVQRQAEVVAAKQETAEAREQCQAATTRVQAEAEQSLADAQELIDQQIADMRMEADRIRGHYQAEARRITDSSHAQLAKVLQDVEELRRYAPLRDAEDEVRHALAEAMAEASALRSQARILLEYARTDAENERLRATEKAKAIYEQADACLIQATRHAGQIVAAAEEKAKETAGDAYNALRDKQILERAAEGIRNIIEGYGDRYLIPTHSLLDELAVEFGYTSAGESLKSARAQSRRMVEQGQAAACDYIEASRRGTAIRFVIDAFNGRVDAILTRVKHGNFGVLEQEIRDAFSLVNLNGKAFRDARILDAYLNARLGELKWAVVVQELARMQLEEQREIKSRMRDEEKARKEYEQQMRQAVKEEELRRQALAEKERELAAARLAFERAAAQDKAQWEEAIAAMQRANEGLREDLAAATARALTIAQQTKKGHVYVISNVGAFGEGVYKIGQTRRLNKQDRIDELGDASVPFDFDVHAWIESGNAPVLEHRLQKRFLATQINKMNSRKEFFRVSLGDIRGEVERLSQTETFIIAHWTETAAATHYRESLDIESDQLKMGKWLKRQEALADREIRLDSLRLTLADIAEPNTQEASP